MRGGEDKGHFEFFRKFIRFGTATLRSGNSQAGTFCQTCCKANIIIHINSRLHITDDKRSVQAFYSIMQVNPASVESLVVDTTEREDWELVARAMKLQPGAVKEVVTRKPALDLAIRTRSSRNNIKDIWDAVGPMGFKIYMRNFEDWFVMCPRRNNRCEQVVKSQAGWARLQQILDMSQDEFAKK